VRKTVGRLDLAVLVQLAREQGVGGQPPTFLAWLGLALPDQAKQDKINLLRRSHEHYPADFWVNHELGLSLSRTVILTPSAVAGADQLPLVEEVIGFYRAALARRPGSGVVYANLSVALGMKGDLPGALAAARKGVALAPNDPITHASLGSTLRARGDRTGSLAAFREAAAVGPNLPQMHFLLGVALHDVGDLPGSVRAFRRATELDPNYAQAYYGLGVGLQGLGDLKGAVAAYRKAIALDPRDALAHDNLGTALARLGNSAEAINAFRQAIQINPRHARAYYNLAHALGDKGDPADSIPLYRRAIELEPGYVPAHHNLGLALYATRNLAESAAAFRRATEVDPRSATAYHNLGNVLGDLEKRGEAVVAYRQAICLSPGFASAYTNLGNTLYDMGERVEAVAAYHQAIHIDPKEANAHGALGRALLVQGRFAEARDATRRCHELLTNPNHPLRQKAAKQILECNRLLALDKKLAAILRGEARPAGAAEQVDLAQLCHQYKQFYVAAARFSAEAFAEQPRLAENLAAGHRYNAACSAARAGCARGKEADRLDEQERTRWRRQALTWLRADLAAWARTVAVAGPVAGPLVTRKLRDWQSDPDLAGLRDPGELARLPAEERAACQRLWADVATLLKRTEPKEGPAAKD
jgi:superkiller protein 3